MPFYSGLDDHCNYFMNRQLSSIPRYPSVEVRLFGVHERLLGHLGLQWREGKGTGEGKFADEDKGRNKTLDVTRLGKKMGAALSPPYTRSLRRVRMGAS